MLSTAQALKEWDRVVKLLSEVKGASVQDCGQPAMCDQWVGESVQTLSRELASPIATWKQLLKKQVSTLGNQ